MAFADAFDLAYKIKCDLQNVLCQSIPLYIITDSLTLFDVLIKSTITTEKRLMMDLQTVKDSYRKMKLNNVAFVQSESMLADSLTKIKPNHLLSKVLSTGIIDHPMEQWIIRNAVGDGSVDKERECSGNGCTCNPKH